MAFSPPFFAYKYRGREEAKGEETKKRELKTKRKKERGKGQEKNREEEKENRGEKREGPPPGATAISLPASPPPASTTGSLHSSHRRSVPPASLFFLLPLRCSVSLCFHLHAERESK
jgi:hypothetical protein